MTRKTFRGKIVSGRSYRDAADSASQLREMINGVINKFFKSNRSSIVDVRFNSAVNPDYVKYYNETLAALTDASLSSADLEDNANEMAGSDKSLKDYMSTSDANMDDIIDLIESIQDELEVILTLSKRTDQYGNIKNAVDMLLSIIE